MSSEPSEVTRLLKRWSAGELSARDHLIPLVYDRLRVLAHHRLRSAPGEHSLNTTALVHEAYLRLVDPPHVDLDTVTELDEALTRLEALSPRQSQLLQHRYFGGLSLEETAAALRVSLA